MSVGQWLPLELVLIGLVRDMNILISSILMSLFLFLFNFLFYSLLLMDVVILVYDYMSIWLALDWYALFLDASTLISKDVCVFVYVCREIKRKKNISSEDALHILCINLSVMQLKDASKGISFLQCLSVYIGFICMIELGSSTTNSN